VALPAAVHCIRDIAGHACDFLCEDVVQAGQNLSGTSMVAAREFLFFTRMTTGTVLGRHQSRYENSLVLPAIDIAGLRRVAVHASYAELRVPRVFPLHDHRRRVRTMAIDAPFVGGGDNGLQAFLHPVSLGLLVRHQQEGGKEQKRQAGDDVALESETHTIPPHSVGEGLPHGQNQKNQKC